MCLTVPARVSRVDGTIAWIEAEGGERPISLVAVESVRPGDFVLHHAGLALSRVEPEEAAAILELFVELSAVTDDAWAIPEAR
jgi:hydrogenase expression/formation protein HypC